MNVLDQDHIQRRLTRVKKVVNSQGEFEKLMEFHAKIAQIKIVKYENKTLKAQVVETTEQADNDQLRQLRIKLAAKKAEISKRKEQLQIKAIKLSATKERFQEERNRELNEFRNIFTAFNDKLKGDIRTDSENR